MKQRCLGCMNEYDASVDVCPHCGYVKGTAEKSRNHLAPGTVLIGRYLIGRCLGQGGFGITYIAWDQRLYKKVAIKEFMPTSLASRITGQMDITCYNDEAQARFQDGIRRMLDESRRLAQFNDLESVVRVYDCFEANQTAYIIMELLEGENIEMILSRQKTIDLPQAKQIMLPVLQALHEIHASGLIHRDISPDNIVVCKNGKVKLLDFGSARVASGSDEKSLSVILKPGYAPKEQYSSSAKQGPYTDVYAVCATIYRMLTGVKPIDSLERHVHDDKLQPIETLVAMPKALAQAIGQGLAIESADRMQTVDPLLEAFRAVSESAIPSKPVKPSKAAKVSKAKKTAKKSKAWIKIVVPVLAVLLAGAAAFFIGNRLGWWMHPPVIEQTDSYTEYQRSLLDQAAAETVPTDLLPAAQDREAWEKAYAKSLAYTADAGKLYADYTDADGRLALHEQILLPKNETDAFTMYAYTESGEPEAVAEYNADGSVGSATCYYYDKDGSLFLKSIYEGDRLQSTTEYAAVKGSNKKLPSVIRYSDGTEERVEFSNKGKDTIEKHFDKNGKKVYERVEYAALRRIKTSLYDKDDDPTQTTVVNLDADGRQLDYEETGYSGVFSAKYTWTYDAQGHLTHHVALDENDAQQSGFLFTYPKGKLHYIIKETSIDKNGDAMREYAYEVTTGSYKLYEYNDNGNKTAVTDYAAFDKPESKTTWTYDAEERVIQEERFDENNEPTESRKDYFYEPSYSTDGTNYDDPVTGYTVYDADGKKTYSIVEADAGSEFYEVKTVYDSKERETHFTAKQDDVLREEHVTEYSSDGRKETQTIYDENGSIVNKWATAYNRDGDIVGEEEYDKNGVLRIKRVFTGDVVTELSLYDAKGEKTDHYILEDGIISGKIVRHLNGKDQFREFISPDKVNWDQTILEQ